VDPPPDRQSHPPTLTTLCHAGVSGQALRWEQHSGSIALRGGRAMGKRQRGGLIQPLADFARRRPGRAGIARSTDLEGHPGPAEGWLRLGWPEARICPTRAPGDLASTGLPPGQPRRCGLNVESGNGTGPGRWYGYLVYRQTRTVGPLALQKTGFPLSRPGLTQTGSGEAVRLTQDYWYTSQRWTLSGEPNAVPVRWSSATHDTSAYL